MVKFTDLVLVICAVLLVLLVTSEIARSSQVPMVKNATGSPGNWSYYDGRNTFIHCNCGPDGFRDMIFYGNRISDTEGWCKLVLVSERTAT